MDTLKTITVSYLCSTDWFIEGRYNTNATNLVRWTYVVKQIYIANDMDAWLCNSISSDDNVFARLLMCNIISDAWDTLLSSTEMIFRTWPSTSTHALENVRWTLSFLSFPCFDLESFSCDSLTAITNGQCLFQFSSEKIGQGLVHFGPDSEGSVADCLSWCTLPRPRSLPLPVVVYAASDKTQIVLYELLDMWRLIRKQLPMIGDRPLLAHFSSKSYIGFVCPISWII